MTAQEKQKMQLLARTLALRSARKFIAELAAAEHPHRPAPFSARDYSDMLKQIDEALK